MTNLNWEKIGPSEVVSPIFNGRILAFADEVRTLAFSKFNPGKNDAIFLVTFFISILFYLSSTLISFEFSGGVGTTLHTTSSVHSVGCVEGP